jgi:hypothetical protein
MARLSFTTETNSPKVTPLPPAATSLAHLASATFVSTRGWVTIGSWAPTGNPRMKLIAIVMLATEQALGVCCET